MCIDASRQSKEPGEPGATAHPTEPQRLRGSIALLLCTTAAGQEMPTATHHHNLSVVRSAAGGPLCVSFRHLASYLLAAHSVSSYVSLYTTVARTTAKTPAPNTVVMTKPSAHSDRMTRLRVSNTTQAFSPVSARISRIVKSCTDRPANRLAWPALWVCSLAWLTGGFARHLPLRPAHRPKSWALAST